MGCRIGTINTIIVPWYPHKLLVSIISLFSSLVYLRLEMWRI